MTRPSASTAYALATCFLISMVAPAYAAWVPASFQFNYPYSFWDSQRYFTQEDGSGILYLCGSVQTDGGYFTILASTTDSGVSYQFYNTTNLNNPAMSINDVTLITDDEGNQQPVIGCEFNNYASPNQTKFSGVGQEELIKRPVRPHRRVVGDRFNRRSRRPSSRSSSHSRSSNLGFVGEYHFDPVQEVFVGGTDVPASIWEQVTLNIETIPGVPNSVVRFTQLFDNEFPNPNPTLMGAYISYDGGVTTSNFSQVSTAVSPTGDYWVILEGKVLSPKVAICVMYDYNSFSLGSVFRSDDGMVSWTPVFNTTTFGLTGISCLADGSLCVLAGSDSNANAWLFQSEDEGLTWTQVQTYTNTSIGGVHLLSPTQLFISGHAGTFEEGSPMIGQSTDGGVTFTQQVFDNYDDVTTVGVFLNVATNQTQGMATLFDQEAESSTLVAWNN